MTSFVQRAASFICLAVLVVSAQAQRKTENVILLMSDGLRWQEVFGGAESILLTKESGVNNIDAVKKKYWRDTPSARREALMPFFWSTVAKHGQIYGNRHLGSPAHVTNGMNFSYPGYNETITGFADPRIDSNNKFPNPNVSVFEWLNKKPAFKGKVAAFGSWDVFPFIFNRDRAGHVMIGAFEPLTGVKSPTIELINKLKLKTPLQWAGEPFDSLMSYQAFEYMKVKRPRATFIGFGETDEFAHEGKYEEYLNAARHFDEFVAELWDWIQSTPQYKDKTTLILTCDHGRGAAADGGWKSHGAKVVGSEAIWIGILGPDTPALGERSGIPAVTQNQIAATLAALLGEDYNAAQPKAGAPIKDALPKK
jgi:hypothetical protein